MKLYATPFLLVLLLLLVPAPKAHSQEDLRSQVDAMAEEMEAQVIAWRRHCHKYPELSNREFKTAAYIAEHLRSLGIEVRTGVAHTGVVGILEGSKPGPVIALRADMDALPVTERGNLAFASTATTTYNGKEVGVMHACGHDAHIAILMGAARVLSHLKADLAGTVKFIFQPAEEGAPDGEQGGASLMIREGVLKNPAVEAIFGLHIWAHTEVGKIEYRPQGLMAAADVFKITVHGAQTHGSTPWTGVDPIVTAAQIIMGLQTIVSRQSPLTKEAAVVTVGMINAGVRNNIIPEQATLEGTIRTLDPEMRTMIHEKVRRTAEGIAESAGATVDVEIVKGTPVTYNDPELTGKMVPVLQAAAGSANVSVRKAITGAEDFAFYQQQIPGLYFFLGGKPEGTPESAVAPHHTPDFYIDESALKLGVRTMSYLALGYLNRHAIDVSGK